jgi:hypothetical protein
MASLIFAAPPAKILGTNGIAKLHTQVAAKQRVGIVRMSESLLDECYESIRKIAETQSHEGKRAILALAEVFQDNSGRRSYDSRSSQNIRAPDRQRIPSDRLRSRSPSRQSGFRSSRLGHSR